MKRKVFFLLFWTVLPFPGMAGSELYIQTFGAATDPAIIFLHGGPGYNSSSFERITAQKLADQGFFVVVYDRRGEGRSSAAKAEFTFEEAYYDISSLYAQYDFDQATLMGHSFGGILATLFAEQYPEKVNAVILVSAPVSLQESFRTIIRTCTSLYQEKGDEQNLQYMTMLESMDTTSLPYGSYCFMHAMQNGFYSPKEPSQEAITLYQLMATDTVLTKYAAEMTYAGPQGFWKNEQYTSINLTPNLRQLVANNVLVYGIYGKNDGLYSPEQVEKLGAIIGPGRLVYLDHCSHSVFIDQQDLFLKTVSAWLR